MKASHLTTPRSLSECEFNEGGIAFFGHEGGSRKKMGRWVVLAIVALAVLVAAWGRQ